MKGNFHVRFLEGGGLATARLHSVCSKENLTQAAAESLQLVQGRNAI